MCTFRLKSNVGCCPCGVLSCLSHVQEYLNKYLNLYFYVRLRLPSVLDCFSRTHAYTDLVYISRVLTWLQSVLDCVSGPPAFWYICKVTWAAYWMDGRMFSSKTCMSFSRRDSQLSLCWLFAIFFLAIYAFTSLPLLSELFMDVNTNVKILVKRCVSKPFECGSSTNMLEVWSRIYAP